MKALHRAAAVRAYRTLATGLAASTVVTSSVALITDGRQAVPALLITLGTVAAQSAASFWHGVASGLPEAPKQQD